MAYVAIDPNNLLPGKPITASLMQNLDGNPVEIADGGADAPYVQAAWHPVDGVTVGDGNTGVIWDFATDGAFATITYSFDAGYDYKLMLEEVHPASNYTIEGFQSQSSTYATYIPSSNLGSAVIGEFVFPSPRVSRERHACDGFAADVSGVFTRYGGIITNTSKTEITIMRLTSTSAETEGVIRMYRRLNYR